APRAFATAAAGSSPAGHRAAGGGRRRRARIARNDASHSSGASSRPTSSAVYILTYDRAFPQEGLKIRRAPGVLASAPAPLHGVAGGQYETRKRYSAVVERSRGRSWRIGGDRVVGQRE